MKSRIERYGQLTAGSRDMLKYIRERAEDQPRYKKIAAHMQGCASMMVFHDYFTVGEERLVKTYTCKKHLLCNFCAARRAAKSVQLNLPKVSQVLESCPGLIPVMITLTVKNGRDLAERYQHLDHSLRRLTQKRRNARKASAKTKTELAKVEAAAMSTEVTFNQDTQEWHPHVHMVALVSDYLDPFALSSEWEDITGDSKIVDVRKIQAKEGDLADGLLEVFKYALKFSDLDPKDRVYASECLQGKRLVRTLGSFRGLEMPEKLVDDPLENLPYLEKVYQYTNKGYELRQVDEYAASTCERSNEQPADVVPDSGIRKSMVSDLKTRQVRVVNTGQQEQRPFVIDILRVTGSAPTPPATFTNDIRSVENEPSDCTKTYINTGNGLHSEPEARQTDSSAQARSVNDRRGACLGRVRRFRGQVGNDIALYNPCPEGTLSGLHRRLEENDGKDLQLYRAQKRGRKFLTFEDWLDDFGGLTDSQRQDRQLMDRLGESYKDYVSTKLDMT